MRRTLRRRRNTEAGSIIWTDGHASYKWSGQGVKPRQHSDVSGFTWDWMNHKKGEFVRDSGVEHISTHGAKSLFGIMKEVFRASGVTNVHDQQAHSSLQCIGPSDRVCAHNSAELQALHEMCFPTSNNTLNPHRPQFSSLLTHPHRGHLALDH